MRAQLGSLWLLREHMSARVCSQCRWAVFVHFAPLIRLYVEGRLTRRPSPRLHYVLSA